MEKPMANQDRLYFDGQCPLCQFEIRHLDRLKEDTLALVDVHSLTDLSSQKKETLLRTLHLETQDGEILLGLDASRHAWSKTGWGGLFAWLGWPVIKPIADAVYSVWARRRFKRRYGS